MTDAERITALEARIAVVTPEQAKKMASAIAKQSRQGVNYR